MYMKTLLTALFALCMLNVHAQNTTTVSDKRLSNLDTAFARVLKTWKAPGFAVAVVEKNKIVYAKGFGYRDLEKKLPVTPNTLFAIGSCTKAFTASLVGLLQQDGKLDIDKPAHQYLPELNFYSEELTNNVTLRDMMSHRTGLPRHDYSWYLFSTTSRDSLVKRIQYMEPTFPLRRQWQYNNFMFVAQGAIIEALTKKSWEENVRQKIFQPLNMTSSELSVHDMEKTSDAALGYGVKNDSIVFHLPYYDINSAGPAGSINSNVLDMCNWVITWINGGKFNGKEILPPAFMKDAISSQTVIGPGLPTKEKPDIYFSTYGFGWMLSSYKGHYRVEHGGNIDGFSALTSFFPTDSIGIIVLSNQDGSPVPSIIRNLIADRLLGKGYFNWNDDLRLAYEKAKTQAAEAEKAKTSTQVKGTTPSHSLSAYEGLYSNAGYGAFDVFLKNDSLFARTPGRLMYLKHYHYDVFTPYILNDPRFEDEDNNYRIQFNTSLNGEIESLNAIGFEAPSIQLVFKRTAKEKPISQSELNKYEGTFTIAGTDIKMYVKENALRMLVPGQPEYEMVSTGKDKFSVKNLNGYSVHFLRDEKGDINAINLIQPNGTFKADKKK
jgi:CubicO group peptidase (beta-lactamase class C family)